MKAKTGLALIVSLVFLLFINTFLFSPETSVFPNIGNEFIFSELYEFSTVLIYLSAAMFLHTEKDHLKDFYLDRTGVLLFIGSSLFVWVRLDISYYLIIVVLAGWMFYTLIKKWSFIKKTNWSFTRPAILYTVLTIVISTVIVIIINSIKRALFFTPDNDIPNILGVFIINIGLVAPTEEFLFRCILWGYLNKTGMQIRYGFIIQFILFWLLHYKTNAGIGFFIPLPLVIFVYSLLAQKSKQLTPSILSHALYNTFLPILWKLLF